MAEAEIAHRTDAEVGMELYVVAGNALHLLLRGNGDAGLSGCDLPRAAVAQLDAKIGQWSPGEMLAGIRVLPEESRTLLAQCCRCAVTASEDRVDTLLGAPASLVETLAQALERMERPV